MSLKRLKGRLIVFVGDATLARPASDPYIRIKLGKHVRKTTSFHGSSSNPMWSEELSFGTLDEAPPTVKVELREHALIGKGKRIASVWVPVSPPPVGRTTIALLLKGEPMGQLTLEVKLDEDAPRSASVTREAVPASAGQGSFGGTSSPPSALAASGLLASERRASLAPERRATWGAGRADASPGRALPAATPAALSHSAAVLPSPRITSASPVRSASLPGGPSPREPFSAGVAPAPAAPPAPAAAAATGGIGGGLSSPRGGSNGAGGAAGVKEALVGSEGAAWLLDHKYLAMPALIALLVLLSLLTILIIVRFLRLEAALETTLTDVAQRIAVAD